MTDTSLSTTKVTAKGAAAERLLFTFVAIFTTLGLLGGLYYRELTKLKDFDTIGHFTQLSTVHTHFLALGLLLGFAMLALVRVFDLSRSNKLIPAIWLWAIGVLLTGGMQVVKGTLQVLGNEAFESPAIAGISGLGHMIITVGFILFLMALGRGLKLDAHRA
ncbi:DUF2871 family protein [Corynebacterium ulceribovis]|uniref:DUF2871 family protein n=1 Tax=Corynebacterium ulceribovis TaxID=487732 RepID=UPI00035D1B75|nr:DUF2871 family protein [Corynebacterium ulceribovis]